MKNKFILIIIFSCFFIFWSCKNYKSSENIHAEKKYLPMFENEPEIFDNGLEISDSIELFYIDYEIIKYNEIEKEFYGNKIMLEKNLTVKILNLEKINFLNNYINPVIYIHYNDNKYIARGQWIFSSFLSPENCDCSFLLDVNYKVIFDEGNKITFIRFENK